MSRRAEEGKETRLRNAEEAQYLLGGLVILLLMKLYVRLATSIWGIIDTEETR